MVIEQAIEEHVQGLIGHRHHLYLENVWCFAGRVVIRVSMVTPECLNWMRSDCVTQEKSFELANPSLFQEISAFLSE